MEKNQFFFPPVSLRSQGEIKGVKEKKAKIWNNEWTDYIFIYPTMVQTLNKTAKWIRKWSNIPQTTAESIQKDN